MKLLTEGNPELFKKSEPFDFDNPVMDPYELGEGLHKVRLDGPGIGLAATQVGIHTRVFVIGHGDEESKQIFFNPEIIEYSDQLVLMEEGCLSFPKLFIKVKRPETIAMTFYTEEGTKCAAEVVGITARVVQHEIDHLDGVTMLQRANGYHKTKALKDRAKLIRNIRNENS